FLPHIYERLRTDFENAIGLYSSSADRKKQQMNARMARRFDNAMLKRMSEAAKKMKACISQDRFLTGSDVRASSRTRSAGVLPFSARWGRSFVVLCFPPFEFSN